jgi:hypothetical protein
MFKEIFTEHHIVAIKEYIKVFILGLVCKQKCIVLSSKDKTCVTTKSLNIWAPRDLTKHLTNHPIIQI